MAGTLGSLALVTAEYKLTWLSGPLPEFKEFILGASLWIFLIVWILFPYWYAGRLRQRWSTPVDQIILTTVLAVMVSLALISFIVMAAVTGGVSEKKAYGVNLFYVPALQWVLLMIAGWARLAFKRA